MNTCAVKIFLLVSGLLCFDFFVFFFFQAEDGIRDYKVTGVQTCALPILLTKQNCCLVFLLVCLFLRKG